MLRRGGAANVLLSFLVAVILCAVIGGGCAISGYRQAVQLDERVKAGWAQVENILQQRYDLIPNLVETVRGYASHEKEIFDNVAEARTKYFAARSPDEKVEAAGGFERALSRLLVLQERYPELKAQESFLKLQDALEGQERRLAVERMRYNESVRTLNAFCRGPISRLFAGWAGVQERKYFEAATDAAQPPKVSFEQKPAGP